MSNNTYNLEFTHWRLQVSQLKEKDVRRITWILGQSRHVRNISFHGYGVCTFNEGDEETHWHPVVEEQETFNRKRSNVAIYDIHVEGGNGLYDKLFLYYSSNSRFPNWGYVLYNTKTKEQVHRYCIYEDIADVISHINRDLNKILWHVDYYEKGKPFTGVCTRDDNVDINGLLKQNDRFVFKYAELPQVYVDKQTYRNRKSFIEI